MKDLIAPILKYILAYSGHYLHTHNSNATHILEKRAISCDISFWLGEGRIDVLDIVTLINDIQQPPYKCYSSENTNSNQEDRILNGYIGMWYPRIWIGQVPEFSYEQILTGKDKIPFRNLVCKGIINKRCVTVNREGLIFVEEDDRVKANRIINNIMALSLLSRVGGIPVREYELGEASVDESGKIMTIGVPTDTQRNKDIIYDDEFRNESPANINMFRQKVNEDIVVNAVLHYEELIGKIPSNFLRFLFESYSHLVQQEYNQAFILSFLIIESNLNLMWDKQLDHWGVSRKRKDESFGSISWGLANSLELLEIEKLITEEEYENFKALRKRRNKFVHEMKEISNIEAESCFNTAFNIVKGYV